MPNFSLLGWKLWLPKSGEFLRPNKLTEQPTELLFAYKKPQKQLMQNIRFKAITRKQWKCNYLFLASSSSQIRLTQVCWPMTSCSQQWMERASSANLRICFWCRRSCGSSWFLCRYRPSLWTRGSTEKVTEQVVWVQWCTGETLTKIIVLVGMDQIHCAILKTDLHSYRWLYKVSDLKLTKIMCVLSVFSTAVLIKKLNIPLLVPEQRDLQEKRRSCFKTLVEKQNSLIS